MNALEVRNVCYDYPDGTRALRGISFTLAEGERLGLIGPNGAGKSTLLWHLNGLLPDPLTQASSVTVFDLPMLPSHLPLIRARVGLLFQNPDDQLFCPTVADDVAFGPQQLGLSSTEIDARVKTSLSQVALPGFEPRHPHRLSHGEKHRVALAGLLAADARLLLLDAPSAGLDPRGRRELQSLLRSLPQAQIIATHDLELVVALCQRVLLLNQGQVVACGPTRDLLNDEPLMLANGLERPHCLRHPHPHD